ncbi:MAG: hypothetical protein WBA17_14870, partial [Saprospiraceae bacterium]
MCITIVDFQATNNNWLHSIVPTFPPLYDISTFTPTSIPASCSGAGTWDWYPSGWTGCETGIAIPPAFGFDSGLGLLQCGGVAGDGDPGNNYGEGGACATINLPSEYLTFCWDITTVSAPVTCAATDAAIRVFIYGDYYSGSFGSQACTMDPPVCFPELGAVTATWTPACPGQPIQLNGFLDGGSAAGCGLEATWTRDGNFFSSQLNPTTTEPGTYQFSLNLIGCAPAESQELIVTYPNQTLTINPNPIQACLGQPVTVNAILGGFGAGTTVEWFNNSNPASPISLGTGNPFTFSPNSSFPVKAVATGASGGCMAMNTANMNFNPVPTNVQITPSPGPYCIGDPITLTASSDQDPNTFYTWNGGSNANPRTIMPSAGGPLTITVTGALGICTETATITLPIIPPPTATISGPNTLCGGDQLTLTASGGVQYDWSWPTGNSFSGNPLEVMPTTTTTYTVTVTDVNGCTNTATRTVTVTPQVTPPQLTCPEPVQVSSFNFSWPAVSGASSYQIFIVNNNTGTTIANTTVPSANYNVTGLDPLTSVTLTVTAVSAANPGCTAESMITCITADCTPVNITFEPVDPICLDPNNPPPPIQLMAGQVGGGAGNFTFTGGPSVSGGFFFPTAPGTFPVTATYRLNDGTCPFSETIDIVVSQAIRPQLQVTGSSVCSTDPFTVRHTGSNFTGTTYSWDFGGATQLSGTGPGPYTLSFPSAGTYTIGLTITYNGCVLSETTTVTVAQPLTPPVINCNYSTQDS